MSKRLVMFLGILLSFNVIAMIGFMAKNDAPALLYLNLLGVGVFGFFFSLIKE